MPARATVAFVPREVFSTTRHALDTLYERTPGPFELVCVDGGSPPEVQAYLQQAADRYGFTLLRTEEYLTPNQARNLAVEHVSTPYVVFVDNDVIVGDDWLRPLVECAEETGAWVVGPLYFEHAPEQHRLHMVGGECRIEQDAAGRRHYFERHRHGHCLLSEVIEPIERCETELIEFHTVLVAMEAFRELGPLDEGLMSQSEHGDLCLLVREAGEQVYVEPQSRITYIPPRRLDAADREFFNLRWSEAWTAATMDRLIEKWRLAPEHPEIERSYAWLRQHRRYGSRALPMLRKLLGRKLAHSLEKRFVGRIEEAVNRRQFPREQCATANRPAARIVYQPLAPRQAAA